MRKSELRRRPLGPGKSRRLSPIWRGGQAGLLALSALLAANPAPAAPGGRLGTLPIGRYTCELPGSATTVAGIAQPKEDFAVLHASRYEAGGERGIYLLTGDLVQMTSGPRNGARYRRISESFLRKLNPNGTDGALRCVRGVPNNGG